MQGEVGQQIVAFMAAPNATCSSKTSLQLPAGVQEPYTPINLAILPTSLRLLQTLYEAGEEDLEDRIPFEHLDALQPADVCRFRQVSTS